MRRAQQGDLDAFDELYERQRRKLFAYALAMLGDRGLAEDVVQDAFVKLAESLGRLEPERGASAWLWRVARNRAIDMLRRKKFEVSGEERAVRERDVARTDAQTPATDMMIKERHMEVGRLLDRLPRRERELLLLRFYGDLTFKQIAQVVRRPLGTVLWQVRRSLETLKRACGETGEEDSDHEV